MQIGCLPQVVINNRPLSLLTYRLPGLVEKTRVLVKTDDNKLFELGLIEFCNQNGTLILMGSTDLPFLIVAPNIESMDPQEYASHLRVLDQSDHLTIEDIKRCENLEAFESIGFFKPIPLPTPEHRAIYEAMFIDPAMDAFTLETYLATKNMMVTGIAQMLLDDRYPFKAYL